MPNETEIEMTCYEHELSPGKVCFFNSVVYFNPIISKNALLVPWPDIYAAKSCKNAWTK